MPTQIKKQQAGNTPEKPRPARFTGLCTIPAKLNSICGWPADRYTAGFAANLTL
jgi:hypothetical protein